MILSEFIKKIDLQKKLSEQESNDLMLNLAIHYYINQDNFNCVRVLSELDDNLLPGDAKKLSRKMIYDRIKKLSHIIH